MRARGPPRRRGFLSNAIHAAKRAFGTVDSFLTAHGAKIKQVAQGLAPVLATKGGAYEATAGALVAAGGEMASTYSAIRSQMAG